MTDHQLDLGPIEAAALRDGTIPAHQAHALIAEVRRLRSQLTHVDVTDEPAEQSTQDTSWASIG